MDCSPYKTYFNRKKNAYNVEIIQEMKQTTGNDFINLFLVGLKDGLYKLKLTAVS